MEKIKNIEEALVIFEDCAIKRGIAIDEGHYKNVNKNFTKAMRIAQYLYNQNSLESLEKYLDYENSWLKLITAYLLLPIRTKKCVSILKSIKRQDGIISFNAEMTLEEWKKRRLKFPYDPDYNW